jgi:hypothetical protein
MVEKSEDDTLHHYNLHESQSFGSRRSSVVSAVCDIHITEKTGNMSEEIWEDLKRRLNLLQIYLGLDDDEDYFLRHAGDPNSDDDGDENGDGDDTVTTATSVTSISSNTATHGEDRSNEEGGENYSRVRIVDE